MKSVTTVVCRGADQKTPLRAERRLVGETPVAFDPQEPDIMYATAQGGFVARVNIANGWHRMMRPSQREGQERLRFNWNSPFLVSKHDPSVPMDCAIQFV